MAGIWGGHKDGIYFRRAAQLFSRIKGLRNVELASRLLRFGDVAPRKGSDTAVFRQRKAGHQPFHPVQPEAEYAEADHS